MAVELEISFRTTGTVPDILHSLDTVNKNIVMKYIAEGEEYLYEG